MQNRSRIINKLALVLISIVVLELVLIGDRVQPVKAIKKKILVKKLKKILPLLALVKPKKKVILVPIPIPMFKKHSQLNQHGSHHNHHVRPIMMNMNDDGSTLPPPSFVMTVLNNNEPTVGSSSPGLMPMQSGGSMMMEMVEMSTQVPSAAMLMPSMTMTIQPSNSAGSGATTTAIELSSSMSNATTGALMLHPQRQQQHFEQFVEQQDWSPGGEHYYSSPWVTRRPPLASPAKLLRAERPVQQSTTYFRPQLAAAAAARPQTQQHSGQIIRQQQQRKVFVPPAKHSPIVVIRNQWLPSAPVQSGGQHRMPPNERLRQQPRQHYFEQQQLSQQQLDLDEFVPVGPPQLMPIYQTANGQYHMTPPPLVQAPPTSPASTSSTGSSSGPSSSFEHEDAPASQGNSADNAEVQTVSGEQGLSEPHGFQPPPAVMTGQLARGNQPVSSTLEPEREQTPFTQQQAATTTARPQFNADQNALKGSKQQPTKRKLSPVAGGY